MNIMFLMGGRNTGESAASYPVYLSEVHNHLILESQIYYVQKISPDRIIFCFKKEDIENYHVDFIAQELAGNAQIVPVYGQTKGAICTALLASKYIDNDEELFLFSIDDCVDEALPVILDHFRNEQSDAGVVSFRSVHPRYSFVKVDDENAVCEFSEKRPISRQALASIYYFRRGSEFVRCAKEVIRKDNPLNGNFYLSQTMNEMILSQKKITVHHIASNTFHPMKTELQQARYIRELEAMDKV